MNPLKSTAVMAAHTPSGVELPPIDAFMLNRVEQLLQQFPEVEGSDGQEIQLVYAAYRAGMYDASLKLGDLLQQQLETLGRFGVRCG